MAVFKYRMQSILDLKCKLEEQQKIAFAAAMARQRQEEARLDELMRKEAEYTHRFVCKAMGQLNVDEVKKLSDARDVLAFLITEQKEVLKKAEQETEDERVRLAEAVKERKIQEKLKEHAFEDFMREEESKERLAIDELISFTHQNDQRGKGGMTDGQET